MEKSEISDNAFNPFQSKFMCCCGSSHVKKGTKIIGIISLFSAVNLCSRLIFKKYLPIISGAEDNIRISCIGLNIILIVFLILLLTGVKEENYLYLLPYLTLQVWSLNLLFLILFYFRD